MQRALMANALGVLKRHWQDLLIVSALCVLSFWVRRLTLWDIEAGGDAVKKWFFVKQWSFANSFEEIPWNHHLARLGINFWAYVAQKLWGTDATVYFIAPVVAATAGVVFSYKLGRELGGRLAGLVAALWFVTLEPMERAGSQLLPEAFEAAYVAGAVYFLLWYLRYQGPLRWRRVLLALVGVFLFAAYLAKVSNLLFAPGILLAAWFYGGNRRDVLVLAAGLVACFLLETLWYNLFTQYSSQFAVISESHKGGTVKEVMRTVKKSAESVAGGSGAGAGRGARQTEKVLDLVALVWKLLERYQVAWESIKFPLFMFLGTSLGLAVFARQTAAKAVALIVFVQLFLMTFAIRQVNPIKVWLSNEPRYMVVLCPLLFATNAAFFVVIARGAVKQGVAWVRGRWALPPRLLRLKRPLILLIAPLSTLVACALIGQHYYEANGVRTFRRGFPLRDVEQAQAHYSDAYARGLPIAEKRSSEKKALRLIYSVYLDDELIRRGDQLPNFEDAVARLGGYDWLSKNPTAYAADAESKLKRSRSCGYMTQLRGRYVKRTPEKKLGANCRAQTGSPD